ncbi:MAG: hypothetical protein GY926_03120 [bacterium]|nr:hypothetical protein [bacterium]MCP4964205.1 hypothetical protein [bacterium]
MNWIRRFGLLTGMFALLLVLGAPGASAAGITEVVDATEATGFYLDDGVTISSSDATEIVTAARNNGSRFYLVVLADTPLGGNTAFAEAVFDELNVDAGTILALSPEDVGWVTENEGFTEADMEEAYDSANAQGGTDAEYAANFVVSLVGIPVATPATTSAPAESSGGGGGSGFLWFILIVGGIGLVLFLVKRRGGAKTVNQMSEQMAKARMAVQKQVDAVANDILDMEDEVRVANNPEVDQFYNTASETYRTVTDELREAESPQQLVGLSNDLDLAIWQLDCAEAILDGKPKPPQPEPKRLEPAPSPSQDRVTIPAPDYQRRPSRRSSYLGPGVTEILIGVAGQVLAGGGRGRGGLGGMLRRSPKQPTPTPRAGSGSSGGDVVPGPGSPVPRSTSSPSSSSSSRKRRSGGGRIRGGGKRRRK